MQKPCLFFPCLHSFIQTTLVINVAREDISHLLLKINLTAYQLFLYSPSHNGMSNPRSVLTFCASSMVTCCSFLLVCSLSRDVLSLLFPTPFASHRV